MADDVDVDVVVIGGGPAGLAAAVALLRSRRSVVVLDTGEPRNAAAAHAHNVFTRDGTSPLKLQALGRAEVEGYGGEVRNTRAKTVNRAGSAFTVETEAGPVAARRVIVATGGRDTMSGVPGLRERWGRDVVHCPYCHGWEVRDQRIGVLATNAAALHQASLFRQLSPHITVLEHTSGGFDADAVAPLAARGVQFVAGEVARLRIEDDRLTGAEFTDGRTVDLDALAVFSRVDVDAELLAPLGVQPEVVEMNGVVAGTAIPADPMGRTAVPGLWVAGNAASPMAQVMTSAAAGLMAGAQVNAELIADDTAAAVAALDRNPGQATE